MRRVTGLKLRQMIGAVWPAVSSVALMALAVLVTLHAARGHSETMKLVAGVAAGALSYPVTLFLVHRRHLQEMVA